MGGRLEPDLGKLWIKATRLVRIAGRKWKPAAFLVLVFSIIGIAWRLQTSQSIIRSDGIGYSSYLRLLVVHHTLDFEQLQNLEQLYGVLRAPRTGRLACQYPIGTAIAELPFFLVGHIVAQVWKYPIDGWSAPYQWSIFAAGMFWFCVGILASWTFVANRTSPGLASIAILTVVFGTNLFHYAVGEPSMSHVYAFGVLGLMLLLGDCFWRAPSAKWALTLGLSVGFLFSIRNYDILFAPVALYPALYPANLQKVKLFGPVFVAGAFLAMLPHFLIVTYYLGAPWANTYWMAPLNWTHSQLGLVLFSVRKGWFFWTPVVGERTPIEDTDLSALRHTLHTSPEVIVVQFLSRGQFKGKDPNPLRVDTKHDVFDGAVLTGCVHPLEDKQHPPALLGIEYVLQGGERLNAGNQRFLLARPVLGFKVQCIFRVDIF